MFLISAIMLTAGTTQHKLKDTGLQDGDGGRLLGNENNYCLLNKIAHNKNKNSSFILN